MLKTHENWTVSKLFSLTKKIYGKTIVITKKTFYGFEILINLRSRNKALRLLRNDCNHNFKELNDIFVIEDKEFLILKTLLNAKKTATVATITNFVEKGRPVAETTSTIFNSANWLEREIFEFYGIFFHNHVNLRNLLKDYNAGDRTALKNFPVIGALEIFWCKKFIKTIRVAIEKIAFIEGKRRKPKNCLK